MELRDRHGIWHAAFDDGETGSFWLKDQIVPEFAMRIRNHGQFASGTLSSRTALSLLSLRLLAVGCLI